MRYMLRIRYFGGCSGQTVQDGLITLHPKGSQSGISDGYYHYLSESPSAKYQTHQNREHLPDYPGWVSGTRPCFPVPRKAQNKGLMQHFETVRSQRLPIDPTKCFPLQPLWWENSPHFQGRLFLLAQPFVSKTCQKDFCGGCLQLYRQYHFVWRYLP